MKKFVLGLSVFLIVTSAKASDDCVYATDFSLSMAQELADFSHHPISYPLALNLTSRLSNSIIQVEGFCSSSPIDQKYCEQMPVYLDNIDRAYADSVVAEERDLENLKNIFSSLKENIQTMCQK